MKAISTNRKSRISKFSAAVFLAALVCVALVTGSFVALPDGSSCRNTGRRYQNPEGYVQISDEISTHGHDYYTSPVLTDRYSTRYDHVEAMILTARRYLDDPFVNRESLEPGRGVDCSGLVMQAAYGAGVDLWPSNPYRHRYGDDKYEWESREIAAMDGLLTVPYKEKKRGDLLFYAGKKGKVSHVAIYLGGGKVIHSAKSIGGVKITDIDYNPKTHVCMVRRLFL